MSVRLYHFQIENTNITCWRFWRPFITVTVVVPLMNLARMIANVKPVLYRRIASLRVFTHGVK